MEGRLCHCGKRKKWEVLEEIPSVLDSPLVLGGDINDGNISNNSYHTPPLASSSIPPLSSSVVESDKKNLVVLYDSRESRLVEIVEDPIENVVSVPVHELSLDFAGISHLIAVHGQRTSHSQGCPKSSFHPYAFCCRLGHQSSTHRPGSLCLHSKTEGGESSL